MKRLTTGLVLLAIGVYVLTNGGMSLMVFLTITGLLAFNEVHTITELKSLPLKVVNMVFYILLMAYLFVFQVSFTVSYFLPIIGLYAIFFSEFLKKMLLFRDLPFLNNLKYFCYIYYGFSSIYLVRETDQGLFYIGLIFASIWATDVFAYYGGKRFGKRPLSSLSPKKTVEGTVIGVASACLLVALLASIYDFSYGYVFAALLMGIFAQMGDLYESLIKRTHGVKDSSNILPGHGGILDRADSSIFVAPLFYFFITVIL